MREAGGKEGLGLRVGLRGSAKVKGIDANQDTHQLFPRALLIALQIIRVDIPVFVPNASASLFRHETYI